MANTNFCIPPAVNRKIKEALEQGSLNVENLIKNGSDYRLEQFTKIAGKNVAEKINTKFGNKFNIELSDEVLDDIFTSFSKIEDLKLKEGYNKAGTTWAKEYVKLGRRLENQINKNNKTGVVDYLKGATQRVIDQPTLGSQVGQGAKELINIVTAPVYKSIKASLDASFALRQGFKVLTKSPSQYKKSLQDTFEVFKNIKSKEAMDAVIDEFKAKLISHPNYNKLVKEGKLAVGVVEDWFPTAITENIPGLGNLFKSSNEAFTIFSQGARFGLADDMLEKAIKLNGGRELTKAELQGIAELANSITGRGSLGRLEAQSGFLNKLFFSARYIRSQLDTFVMPFNTKLSPFAQKEARNHSLTTLSTIATMMATASLFGDVEWDPRSTNFGRVNIPGTKRYIDLTAGLGSYITLAVRQATGETKNSKGKLTKLNSGEFGSRTRGDVLADWAVNKLAPAPATIKQVFLDGELYGGEEITAQGIAKQLIAPISAENAYEYLTNEDLGTALLLSVSDAVGLGTK